MRRINTFDDANIVSGEISRWKDKVDTNHWDRRQLRITNNAPAKDDSDYTTLNQLNPKIIFKIGTPLIGVNVTNRVMCNAQPGVRINRWHVQANIGPTGAKDIFDIRRLKIGETDFTKATSIFPSPTNDKVVLPVGAIRAKGAKFVHTPYDFFYEEELIFDVLSIGTTAGTQIIITLDTQLLGVR